MVEPGKQQNVKVSLENLPLAKTYPMIEAYKAPVLRYVQAIVPQYQEPRQYEKPYYQQNIQEIRYNYRLQQSNIRQYAPPPPLKQQIQAPYKVKNVGLTRKIEGDAKKLLGKKYVWGATGPRTYDCSGFTQKIYRDAGINIPRVSRDQAKVGQYVSYKNMKKGDLVFFDTHKKKTGKVTHVGIYLGNNNFIHASSGAKKIVIFNLEDKKFYKNRFLWARRVLPNNTRLAMK
jgi:cell wall-associated NlpC family hydrolase